MKPFRIYLYGPDQGPLETSFEFATERLERLCHASVEPDGSFGWASSGGGEKLYGMLYDAAGRLQYVDLQGQLSLPAWRQVLAAICGETALPAQLSILQLPDQVLKSLQTFEADVWPDTST